jgi:hypothetical protein
MSEPEEMTNWAYHTAATELSNYVTTTSSSWSATPDPQMIKAWMRVLIRQIEQLQVRVSHLEGRTDG